jgi:hypothetical protein
VADSEGRAIGAAAQGKFSVAANFGGIKKIGNVLRHTFTDKLKLITWKTNFRYGRVSLKPPLKIIYTLRRRDIKCRFYLGKGGLPTGQKHNKCFATFWPDAGSGPTSAGTTIIKNI